MIARMAATLGTAATATFFMTGSIVTCALVGTVVVLTDFVASNDPVSALKEDLADFRSALPSKPDPAPELPVYDPEAETAKEYARLADLYFDNPTAFWLNPNGPLAEPVTREELGLAKPITPQLAKKPSGCPIQNCAGETRPPRTTSQRSDKFVLWTEGTGFQ